MDINKKLAKAHELHRQGKLQEAELLCRKVLQHYPKHPDALNLLGTIYYQLEDYESASSYIKQAIAINPKNVNAYYLLGGILNKKGDRDGAISNYQKAIDLNPRYAGAYNNLGNALRDSGQLNAAITPYQKAIELDPFNALPYNNLGNVFQELNQLDAAINSYKKALEIDPDYFFTLNNLGNALFIKGHFKDAFTYYQKALQLNPHYADVHYNLGKLFEEMGNLDEAEKLYRQAFHLKSDPSIYSTLLLSLHYGQKHDRHTILHEHKQFAKIFADPFIPSIRAHANNPDPHRRLKIGYVSPDFRRHSVGFFIEPVLSSHNHGNFEIFCYANLTLSACDAFTDRMKHHADHWRPIIGLSEEQAENLIRQDEIDILIDLAGHTGSNRMMLFARKPAPVQVSWIGYPDTTGLKTMDYKIVDFFTDPPGIADQCYTEHLIRLPHCFLCYLPHEESPEIEELPALTKGHITFGSFNNFTKASSECITIWAKTLKMLPASRLLLKAKNFLNAEVRNRALEMFFKEGIPADRVELLQLEPSTRQHLNLYNQIDIGLDTFPYNGTTTTCEALWLGVPVITLAGNAHVSRVGVSLLSNVGAEELIAKTGEEYIEIAVNLARDVERLKSFRRGLRALMAQSSLTDARQFTGNLENSYRMMWEHWCKSH
jgi:predicted O-linked N-acetylglucosamine transferase (SPINDLY family)